MQMMLTDDSPWPWHPPTHHFSTNNEPLPSDLPELPCGELSRHADVQTHSGKTLRCRRDVCTVPKNWPPSWSNYYSQCCEHLERLRSAAGEERCWGDPWKLLHGLESNQTRRKKMERAKERRTMWKSDAVLHVVSSQSDKTLTSVIAWMEAPYLISSSITFTLFFLQAMWRGVNPFW